MLSYFSVVFFIIFCSFLRGISAARGIRTPVSFLTSGFQDRPVMAASVAQHEMCKTKDGFCFFSIFFNMQKEKRKETGELKKSWKIMGKIEGMGYFSSTVV